LELLEQLNHNQMLMAVGALGLVVGALIMHTFTKSAGKMQVSEDPRNHRIREVEAELRTVHRQFADCEQALEEKTEEFNTSVETLQELRVTLEEFRATLAEREEDLSKLKGELKGSVTKTRELRTELQDRATETIREQLRAEEAETELDVARAGSEAVLSEIGRLQKEHKKMTDTMTGIEDPFLADEDFLDEGLFDEDVSKNR
jgi:chromosome segregation ATPase